MYFRLVIILLIFAFAIFDIAYGQVNYCSAKLCRNGKKHIACNNNGAFSSQCASNARMIPVTGALRKNIVNEHNKLRGRIARGGFAGYRPALRMATMRWNDGLAYVASFNVKQCVMKHDKCRNTPKFHYAGQNLAMTSWYGLNKTVNEIAMQHMGLWFDEYKDASMAIIKKYPQTSPNGKAIGHFTQLMQEKATHVGCAILRQDIGTTTYQFMACNYAYTNIYGYPVYRSGNRAGAKCKTGRNPVYKSLCSAKEYYNVNKIT